VDFIDNNTYTTDTISGLDWLDVTTSVNQSFAYVSSQFNEGEEHAGWRYATGIEFNAMVSNWTGTTITPAFTGYVYHSEGLIDGLHLLLGSTMDSLYTTVAGDTFDALNGKAEGGYADFTRGMLADADPNDNTKISAAQISDDDRSSDVRDYTTTRFHTYSRTTSGDPGSFLIRNTVAPIPIPASAWLMGSGLAGLLGFSRKKKI